MTIEARRRTGAIILLVGAVLMLVEVFQDRPYFPALILGFLLVFAGLAAVMSEPS